MVQTRAQRKQITNNQIITSLIPQPIFNVESVNMLFEKECLQTFPRGSVVFAVVECRLLK